MKQIPIKEIEVDSENRLLLHLKIKQEESYEYIYRDASGITWLNDLRCLGAREPAKWNHSDLFKQIVAAVRNEYGDILVVTPETKWTNIPAELKSGILNWLRRQ